MKTQLLNLKSIITICLLVFGLDSLQAQSEIVAFNSESSKSASPLQQRATGTIEHIPAFRFDQTVFLNASVENDSEAKVLIINSTGKPVKEFDPSETGSDYLPLYGGTLSPGQYACRLINQGNILSEVSFKVLSR